ncbi:MAG: DUF4299 family protein [Lachnospiraceae bacterium]|nr:DUF4299 family protein [Lachnospiraceae bacterium]
MQCILTLAMFPWYMDEEKREQYKECSTLIDFEKTVHELQVQDIYYAKPTLLRRNEDGQIAAVYTLTTGCESCFPVRPESFINLSGLKIDAAFIRFFIFEEKRAVDSFFPYSEFIEFIKEKGAVKFDAERIKVQPLSKEDVAEFIGKFEK